MWKTINYLGKEVIWYSQEEVKEMLAEIKEIAELKQKQSVFVGETVFEQILQKINEVKTATSTKSKN